MVNFETVKSEQIAFGDDEFIEIAKKRAIGEEGEDEFISLSRGYYDGDDQRYKTNFSIPIDDDVITFLTEQLPAMLDSATGAPRGDDG